MTSAQVIGAPSIEPDLVGDAGASAATTSTTNDPQGRILRRIYRDFLGYLSEYTLPLRWLLGCCCSSKADQSSHDAAWADVQAHVDGHTIALFVKPGCGFCERAEALLKERCLDFGGVNGVAPAVAAVLRKELMLPLLTYPVVFVGGAYLGGADQLQEAADSGRLVELMQGPQLPFPRGVFYLPDPIRLLRGPLGQPWYCFQLHVYPNYVRLQSIVHVAIFAFAIGAPAAGLVRVAQVLLWVLIVDMAIFVALGPSPFALVSTISTIFVWRFRGGAVTSLPYKVVMGIFYIVSVLPIVICDVDGGSEESTCEKKLSDAKGRLASLLTNSALLAALRF